MRSAPYHRIQDGDLVVVEPTGNNEVRNGEIVAARIDGDAAIKRYFARDGKVALEPASPAYEPIVVSEFEDFTVLGRVAGLFRRFAREAATSGTPASAELAHA